MTVSERMLGYSRNSSWIRRMFEEGGRLKAIHGQDNVYDFSLGNPDVPPPRDVLRIMSEKATEISHGYMSNAGYPHVREKIAEHASVTYEADLSADDIIMTCGAGGGLNVVLKAILDPGDEVIAIAPYFVEYGFYTENHGGKLVPVRCADDFLPDIDAIASVINEKTKAIIINTPNNPSGRIYPETVLSSIRDLIADHPRILVISDEPYRRLAYGGIKVPSVLKTIPNSVVVTSSSKELSLAGERIGYIALGPGVSEKSDLAASMVLATRILGFVNAPALMQEVLGECIEMSVDISEYERRRNLMCSVMDAAGLEYVPPEGAFYLFVKAPDGDDSDFCRRLVEQRILAVPGRGFGYEGYVRFAYCVDEKVISGAAEGLGRVVASY